MMRDAFTILAVFSGAVLFMAGTLALLRFPDRLSRLHALTKVDNLGLGLVVAGLAPQVGWLVAAKLLCVWLLVQFSGSIVTQILAGTAKPNEKGQ
jgi:multicomponent Na+:H+ antiporter subunit G